MTPVSPPHPAEFPGPVDQLTTPDEGELPADGAEHRRTGIAGAGAEARFFAPGCGVVQADLQVSGPPGGDEVRRPRGSAGLAVAAHRDAEARDREGVAWHDGQRGAEDRGFHIL